MNETDASEMRLSQAEIDTAVEMRSLRQELVALRTSVSALSIELTSLRIANAEMVARMGRPSYAQLGLMAGLVFAILVQTGYGMYWAGGIAATQRSVLSLIEGIARRNEIANRNWDALKGKGLELERTVP
jgi:hypothetical protein